MRRIFRLSSNPPSLLPQRESGSILPVIIIKIGVFILMRGLDKAIRNYYENRLFSFSCVVLEEHPQFSPQWESRVPNLVRVCRNVPVGTSTCPPGAS